MSQSLNRLLRLRKMTEELRESELSREAQKLASIENAIDASAGESRLCREEAFRAIAETRGEDWLLATGAQELAEWRIRTLSIESDMQRLCVEESRARFLECRIEKRQVEKLLEAEDRVKQMQKARRDQAALDDWFKERRSPRTSG
jgi:flagellar export protein FliJ